MDIMQEFYFGKGTLDPNRPRRVALYGRVSTQHEAQIDALSNQMQWYDEQTQHYPNWTVVARYIDEGITGTSAKKRPAFMQMLGDAKRNKFDLIVTREVCRFARNTLDTLQITRRLREIGVEVFFVNDGIWTMDGDGELRLTIMATMAQEESRKISERVRAGQEISRKKGVLYGNGNIIGYDRVEGSYVVNEKQAETIRMVFRLYAQGLGEKGIVNELTRLGCLDGAGRVNWSCSKVSRILRNATYKGYIGYNKSTVTNFLSKRRVNNLDESSYVYVKGDFEPLVSEELWDECERIRKGRICVMNRPDGKVRHKGVRESHDLWVRKLRCRCGSSYRKFKWRTLRDGRPVNGFQCTRRTVNPSKRFVEEHGLNEQDFCPAIAVGEWKLDLMAKLIFSQVWGKSKAIILDAYSMVESMDKEQQSALKAKQQRLERKKKSLEQRKQAYMRMRADGELDRENFKSMMAEADAELQKLDETTSGADSPEKKGIDLEKVRKALDRTMDLSGVTINRDLVEEFVEVVTPIEDYIYRWKLSLDGCKNRYERADLMTMADPPIMEFTVDYETAYAYRKLADLPLLQFHRSAWHDLKVEVYL